MKRRTALIFYVLSVYVFVQFIWWGYHLIELTEEVSLASEDVSKRVIMILGEGVVFLLLLVTGIWQIHRSIGKELKLSERQNNFLLSVTHELKTPLAANKLYLQTVTKRELTKDQQNELIKKAIEENTRLERMIDNILNASRLENNALKLEKEHFDLTQLMQGIASRFNTMLEKETVELENKESISISADKFLIETILNNLVDNALKYAGNESPVVLYANVSGGSIHFGVKDQGPGISKENKSEIFKKFFRVGNEEIRTQKGSGLGLFIVRQLVRMHGGTVSCLDNQPKGTDFKITLHHD